MDSRISIQIATVSIVYTNRKDLTEVFINVIYCQLCTHFVIECVCNYWLQDLLGVYDCRRQLYFWLQDLLGFMTVEDSCTIWMHNSCIIIVSVRVWFMVFNATFNNSSVISWRSVLLVEETGENHRPVASHSKTL